VNSCVPRTLSINTILTAWDDLPSKSDLPYELSGIFTLRSCVLGIENDLDPKARRCTGVKLDLAPVEAL
jgi:hypothetical protein